VEWAIGTSLIRPLFFWNPAFHIWARQVEQVREMSCDRQVLARRRFDVAAYCDCLLRVCRDGINHRRLMASDPPVAALLRPERLLRKGRSALLRRLASAIDGRRESNPRLLSAFVAIPILAMTLTAAIAIQKPADWTQDRIMLSTIINLARLEAINANAASFGALGY
jgi:beta-lactamase regulating signal transducer with metallopeptidase domain